MGSKTYHNRLDMLMMLCDVIDTSVDRRSSVAHMLRSMQQSGVGRSPTESIYTYLIGTEEDKYITRTLLPRIDDSRMLIHTIHRDDRDPHPHDHPWDEAVFIVIEGGYVDERWFYDETALDGRGEWRFIQRLLLPGSVNQLRHDDYHRAIHVRPNTLTLGVVGKRVQEWGFMVDGKKVPHAEYRGRVFGGQA